ncbi:MAG: glycerophosphodiester phosphodiesterase [Gammaproteobacteria bacterium]|nr:glycerophosphodiester phosphodiesterase [Gammaproteobacteria bacterium]
MSGQKSAVLNIAHRGARAFAPENTLAAFAKANDFGCDMFELDVRLSKDNVVVVHHDENLLRCTDAKTKFPDRNSYQLEDFTYSELSTLDAGNWFCAQLDLPGGERQPFLQSLTDAEIADFISEAERRNYSSGDIKIPTLTESLELAKELGLMVNVELKSGSPKDSLLVINVIKAIEAAQMEDNVLISSFYLELVKQVRQHNEGIATAALTEKPLKTPLTTLRNLKANACNMGCFGDFKRHGFNSSAGKRYLAHLKKLRDAGYGINIWTCNNPDEMAALINGGVTGLITDYLNRAKVVINAHVNTL